MLWCIVNENVIVHYYCITYKLNKSGSTPGVTFYFQIKPKLKPEKER